MEEPPDEPVAPPSESLARPRAWDGLLVGPENELAVAAVRALARGEAGLSPLVLHGGAGVGKTRLLECLAGEIVARRPWASVALLGAEGLAEQCEEAAAAPGGWAELRERLHRLDLLAVDGLPELSRHPLAVGELGSLLDTLVDRGALVAATAATAPGSWEGWPARLMDRLRMGLAVRVGPPGEETRRRFVMDRARDRGLTMRPEAVEALVSAADGYRPLEGRLARLALRAKVERRPIDRDLAEGALAEDGAGGGTVVPLATVARAVAARFGVRMGDLRSADRHRGLVVPRHLAILLARELSGLSFAELGKGFGGRDTKTIRHACAAARERLVADPALAAVAEEIRRGLIEAGG